MYKKINELNEDDKNVFRNLGIGYSIVSVLPEIISPNILLMYNGELYRGILDGESSLPVGTPIPICGYREYICMVKQMGENNPVQIVQKNTLGYDTSWIRLSAGVYILPLNGESLSQVFRNNVLIHYDIGQEDYGAWVRLDVAKTVSLGTYIKFEIFTPDYNYYDWDKGEDTTYSQYLNISFKIFPPK